LNGELNNVSEIDFVNKFKGKIKYWFSKCLFRIIVSNNFKMDNKNANSTGKYWLLKVFDVLKENGPTALTHFSYMPNISSISFTEDS
jgi:hypothetical protein